MPLFENGHTRISYDTEGEGPPVLLLAPGGMRSANNLWNNMPWNPRKELKSKFQLIGMDQRNAGNSTGPITEDDGWDTYKQDQIALLNHLEIETCHLVGMCIGGPFIANLLKENQGRFKSAVLLQPVGIDHNREAFYEMFDSWSKEIINEELGPSSRTMERFKHNMWDGEFLLTVSEEDIKHVETPLLVLMGDDLYHPQTTSRKLVELAHNAILIQNWKDKEYLQLASHSIIEFLLGHS